MYFNGISTIKPLVILFIFLFFALCTTITVGQNKYLLKGRIVSLPTSKGCLEYYFDVENKFSHYFESNLDLKTFNNFNQGKACNKIENKKIFEAINFITSHNLDSIWIFPYDKIDTAIIFKNISDSIKHKSCNDKGFIVNFNLFVKLRFKPEVFVGTDIQVIKYEPRQIDGAKLIVTFTNDSVEKYSFNIGVSNDDTGTGEFCTKEFREWIIFYYLYNEFGLFNKFRLDKKFSYENLNLILRDYMELLSLER